MCGSRLSNSHCALMTSTRATWWILIKYIALILDIMKIGLKCLNKALGE